MELTPPDPAGVVAIQPVHVPAGTQTVVSAVHSSGELFC